VQKKGKVVTVVVMEIVCVLLLVVVDVIVVEVKEHVGKPPSRSRLERHWRTTGIPKKLEAQFTTQLSPVVTLLQLWSY